MGKTFQSGCGSVSVADIMDCIGVWGTGISSPPLMQTSSKVTNNAVR